MGARVVVVDDQRDLALAVQFALDSLGHETRIAHDAVSGLRAVIEHAPEIVLIDIVMPLIDGWQLARSIRDLRLAREPRLVAMSGFASSVERQRSAAEGFEAHLAKPIGISDLARLVDRAN